MLSPAQRYQELIQSDTIQYDIKQDRVIKEIDKLYDKIQMYSSPKLPNIPLLAASYADGTFDGVKQSKQSKLSKPSLSKQWRSGDIFKRLLNRSTMPIKMDNNSVPNSLYIWGGTGTGKTMLMDVLYDSITSHSKQRVHFNTFMLELHDEIHQIEQKLKIPAADVLPQVSLNIASRSTILYLDEFAVTDLVDALLLNRLFTSLFYYGVICFITSNREPDMLYFNGLQRNEIFIPFLKLLKQKTMIIDLNTINYRDSDHGYGYFVDDNGLNNDSKLQFEDAWNKIIRDDECLNGDGEKHKIIQVMGGRELSCPRSIGCRATRFKFNELCAENKGSADYLALSKSFCTIFIENIPFFKHDDDSRNEMKRFIWLIDELYNGKNRIICLAADKPDNLLQIEYNINIDPTNIFEEMFQFERCRKRLYEMQSIQYLDYSSRY